MARRTKEEAEQTRRALLDTALTLFSEKGIANVTLAQIASAAGVTRGAIYWHFKDKAQLIEILSEEIFDPLEKKFEDLFAQSVDDQLTALHQLGIEVFDQAATNSRFKMMCGIMQQACFDKQMESRVQELSCEEMTGMITLMSQAQEKGVLRKDISPEASALAVIGFFQGVIERWLLTENILDLAAESKVLISVLVDGLRAK